jgi:hypothetical protein
MIIDFEFLEKERRQKGADTEINRDSPEDLEVLCDVGVPHRFCRVNRPGLWTDREVESAIAAGANHLLLPMVESPDEIELLARRVAGRCTVGILVETLKGVDGAEALAALQLEHVYVGLNDLAIDRGSECIFDAVADGTVDRLRYVFAETAFGFGGATVVDRGYPIPCRLLLAEMARLQCDFTFLRRSFKRDMVGRDLPVEIGRIRDLWEELADRDRSQVERDREALLTAIKAAGGGAA